MIKLNQSLINHTVLSFAFPQKIYVSFESEALNFFRIHTSSFDSVSCQLLTCYMMHRFNSFNEFRRGL